MSGTSLPTISEKTPLLLNQESTDKTLVNKNNYLSQIENKESNTVRMTCNFCSTKPSIISSSTLVGGLFSGVISYGYTAAFLTNLPLTLSLGLTIGAGLGAGYAIGCVISYSKEQNTTEGLRPNEQNKNKLDMETNINPISIQSKMPSLNNENEEKESIQHNEKTSKNDKLEKDDSMNSVEINIPSLKKDVDDTILGDKTFKLLENLCDESTITNTNSQITINDQE